MGTRFAIPAQTFLDAAGNGEVEISFRGRGSVFHTRVSVTVKTPVPTALLYQDGLEFEGTNSGSGDVSDTRYDMDTSDTIRCEWTGGAPGALATLTIRGVYE